MNSKQLVEHIKNGGLDTVFTELYGSDKLTYQKDRYIDVIENYANRYDTDSERDVFLFSVAGRSELSGNHTDHNHGKVIAGSIDLDIIAAVSARNDNLIRLTSCGFGENIVDFAEYTEPRRELYNTSEALIAGMCRAFSDKGYSVGGFDAYTSSNVLKGSGLSSSAAFEDMIGNILNHMYNGGKVDNVEIAKLAQFSENVFFGKPCGLMDQMACAVGGIISIDFEDTRAPLIERLDFDITAAGYNLCIVNTGGNHADLGEDYASVPNEMKAVAECFGKQVLREVDESDILADIQMLRERVGDRAILRALHFMSENKRVDDQKKALKCGDLDAYFADVIASGRSSFCYLQNVYTTKNLTEQGLSLALCLAEGYLQDKRAAWRVHGGGFAGTIQAYVPICDVDGFRKIMDDAFGDGACIALKIRRLGALRVF